MTRRVSVPVKESDIIFLTPDMSWFHNTKMRMEHAVDIIVPIGSEVRAAASGEVTDASEDSDGYKGVDIEHGDGTYTNYGHLSKIMVMNGEKVTEGQIIGLSGDTGNLGGLPPHLHFEVSVKEKGLSKTVPFKWKNSFPVQGRRVQILVPMSLVKKYENEMESGK